MKDLLDKVLRLNREYDENEFEALVNDLGETPSLAVLEAVLKHYKKIERDVRTGDLLEWMQENDLLTFENDDVKVKIDTYVSAKVQDTEAAFSWLNAHQYGDLIKDSLDFPKGELTPEVEADLEARGLSFTKKSGIHPQSLKKIMADRLKAQEPLPDQDEGFEINYYDECKVKQK
jgi:hypothetical protein